MRHLPLRRPRRGHCLPLLLALALLLALSFALGHLARPPAVTGAVTFGYAVAATPPWVLPARTLVALTAAALALWGASLLLGGERAIGPFVLVSVLGRYTLLPIAGLLAVPAVRRGLAHLVVVSDGHIVATGARTTLPWVGVGLLALYVLAAVVHLRLYRTCSGLSAGRAALGCLLGLAVSEALCRAIFAVW